MPLNKLENFIKNIEGRILYVNPSDLDSSDSIENEGNSLTKPFKTIQRALIESARFSYLSGNSNDQVEKTTILLFPGEHVVDNRPGNAIRLDNNNSTAYAVPPSGGNGVVASTALSLSNSSIFDLTQEDNILVKFNSVNGGVIVPRGTSIVGLDLRKTKIRPKYVPNPTNDTDPTAIFRVTGACYFWQFSFFDGDENGEVYTEYDSNTRSTPTFSHHKLTCFEYADGVNIPDGYTITDLDMYYAKLSNAFLDSSGRAIEINDRYPASDVGFSKQRPEWEIVGAFASDPINIASATRNGALVTVTTTTEHELTQGTPIKLRDFENNTYNISTKVSRVISPTQFTYSIISVPPELPTLITVGNATVTIETDTVSGASPYIFNISMRSIWGMNGMLADGAKASGFRSMVVAQFTAISLQKDDRAFVKYNKTSRQYQGIDITPQYGSDLSKNSSSTNSSSVYHLDSSAIYRKGWETSHIKATNDGFIQIVSVFAIGFTRHFDARSGADFSVTNSNSNFGQLSLASSGFKNKSFNKDNKALVSSIITPRAITVQEEDVDWISIDVDKTYDINNSSRLYLYGFNDKNDAPPVLTKGYRVGAKTNDKLYVDFSSFTGYGVSESSIVIDDDGNSAYKTYEVTSGPTYVEGDTDASNILTIGDNTLATGEKVLILSEDADVPENIIDHKIYYVIKESSTTIKLASSTSNAENGVAVNIYNGTNLKIISRVSDKNAGEKGSPVIFDDTVGVKHWYIRVSSSNNQIFDAIKELGKDSFERKSGKTNVSTIKRKEDSRSIDEKLYKLRVVIPKTFDNVKNPEEGFVIQESRDTTNNLQLIAKSEINGSVVTITTEKSHNLKNGDIVIIKKVTDSTNTSGTENSGYNGTFTVTNVGEKEFSYSTTDIFGTVHTIPGNGTNDVNDRSNINNLPRLERNDLLSNFYVYRREEIIPYVKDEQDGVYHLFVLNASNTITEQFTDSSYSQNVTDLYPQLDRDNVDDNPLSAVSFAKRYPVGSVVTNDLKSSLTKETIDKFSSDFRLGLKISGISGTNTKTLTLSKNHNLNGIFEYDQLTGGANYLPTTATQVHYNVKLLSTKDGLNNTVASHWKGATANVTVTNGVVTAVEIVERGSAYVAEEELKFDSNSTMGPGNDGAKITIISSNISNSIGDTLQVTGSNKFRDGYYRVATVPSSNTVTIETVSSDPSIEQGQILVHIGPQNAVSTSSFSATTKKTTITCTKPHGLYGGNRIRLVDANNNSLGDYDIDVAGVTSTAFDITTNEQLSTTPLYVLKHGLASNNLSSDIDEENLASRAYVLYENEDAVLKTNITNQTTLPIQDRDGNAWNADRFKVGDYLQIDDEIVKITNASLQGANTDSITVERGSLGTAQVDHESGVVLKKFRPLSIEFRRPTYVRASGHTFEYLGFGPGNYSTGLPQVQNRTLTQEETYLAQAQERSAGIVVYTGMNNNGDFFIGNKRVSSATGQEQTFDIPVPSITGQDPSRLSVVFDEVIVKERILVEGGNSRRILSQFDGPVTFNGELRINSAVTFNQNIRIVDDTESDNYDAGALVVDGSLGAKYINAFNGNFSGIVTFSNETVSTSSTTGAVQIRGGVGIAKTTNIGGTLNALSGIRVGYQESMDENHLRIYNLNSDESSNYNSVIQNKKGNLIIRNVHEISPTKIDPEGGESASNYIDPMQGVTDRYIYIRAKANEGSLHDENSILCQSNGYVKLYYNGGERLSTINTGVSITGELQVSDDITAFYSSDERLKDNVTAIDDPLAKVLSLGGYTFDWNENTTKEGTETGVIAQEVEALGLPGLVTTRDNGYLAVNYEKLVPLLIEAVKELSSKVDALEEKLSDK